jgi:hypothetical protein
MKFFVGQIAIVFLILGAGFLCYLNTIDHNYKLAIPLFIWTLIIIILGFWTWSNPKRAFGIILAFYILSVVIKDILIGGEYGLTLLFHIYFH